MGHPTAVSNVIAFRQNDHLRDLSVLGHSRQSDLTSRFLATEAFSSRKRYCRFLLAQHHIGREMKSLYDHPLRSRLLPDLQPTDQLRRIERDLHDLGCDRPRHQNETALGNGMTSAAALCGALFIAEGARLMFPWFRKQAGQLGLDDRFGARHLAWKPAELRLRWACFREVVNAMQFSGHDMLRMAAASEEAMRCIQSILDEETGSAGRHDRLSFSAGPPS